MTEFNLNFPTNNGEQKQLTIRSGEIIFMVGPNGTGKSTLIKGVRVIDLNFLPIKGVNQRGQSH